MDKIICWWSGGVTSAVACKQAIDLYGKENCEVIMIDTMNEHIDTYRFLEDCSKWYGLEIKIIKTDKYKNIQDVWYTHKQLNTANGAVCSYMLKRRVREKWEKENKWSHQVFGFEFEKREFNRALSLRLNHSHTNPIFPLLMMGMDKQDCIDLLNTEKIRIPFAYRTGFKNNNCLQTGCISGGLKYWAKIKRDMPEVYANMSKVEHDLTALRGYQVTMLKDQSKEAREKKTTHDDKRAHLVFLEKHPDYPYNKSLDEMNITGEPKPLNDCNGFCGVDDLNPRSETQLELNEAGGLQ